MAVIQYNQASRRGAMLNTSLHGQSSAISYGDTVMIGAWIDTYSRRGHRVGVLFEVPSSGDLIPQPEAADRSEYSLCIGLSGALRGIRVSVKTLTAPLSAVYETRYEQLEPSDEIGMIPDGGRTAELPMTKAQFFQAAQYGIGLAPVTTVSSPECIETTKDSETYLFVNAINPAAKGEATNIQPGALSVLVGNEAQEISYRYEHPYGGYAQGLLGVLAENVSTGERIVIFKKAAQTVANGGTGSFTIPADTLSAGTWDITVSAAPAAAADYFGNDDDFWLTGQTVRYTVKDNPETGGVTCDGHPVPTVSWTATAQAAYQVRFGDYDSGARAGSETSFTVPRIFGDGAYPVRVRTATAAGEWSAWTEPTWAAIRNAAPAGTMTLRAETEDGCVRLTWEDLQPLTGALLDSNGRAVLDMDGEELLTTVYTAQADRYAVFRDGRLIAVTTDSVFTDRIGGGEYQVLAMSGTYYIPSNIVTYWPRLACDMISADGGESWIALKYTPELKSEPESVTTEITYYYYAGRSKPVAVSTGQVTRAKNFSYRFKNRADAQRIRAMNGAAVILKTTRGEWIEGVLENINYQDSKIVTVTFSIRETDTEADYVEYTV